MGADTSVLEIVRNDVENYAQTVDALLGFAALVVHDGRSLRPGSNFGFGRRMTTSEKNRVRPSQDVTPDLVAQKSDGYGVVTEVKKTLSRDKEYWKAHITQLHKYDDDLTGWWTSSGSIAHSDTILLIHISRSREFSLLLEELAGDGTELFSDSVAVVEFSRADEAAPYFFFRRDYGTVHDEELDSSLELGKQVPLNHVRESFPSVKYYDSPPPLPLLLQHLWMDMFPSYLDASAYDEKLKATRIELRFSDVVDEIQKAYGSGALSTDPRSCEFPKKVQIREAFERLVKLKMAIGSEKGAGVYVILYKQIRGDVLDRFIELVHDARDAEQPGDDAPQMDLFVKQGE